MLSHMASGARGGAAADAPIVTSFAAMRLESSASIAITGCGGMGGGGIAGLLGGRGGGQQGQGQGVGLDSAVIGTNLAPMVGSYGTRVGGRPPTLAASFREASAFQPLSISEEDSALVTCDQNSDDEWAERKVRGVGRRVNKGPRVLGAAHGDSSDEDADADATPPTEGDIPLASHDGDVFQSDF